MKEKKINIKTILFIFMIIIISIGLWARYINTKGLKVHEYGIVNEKLPSSFHGLKIVHFSDIHYGQTTNLKDLKKIVKKINELRPDVIIFTGDLFNKNIKLNNKEIDKITKELNKIDASLYKYAVSGDADKLEHNSYQEIMEKSGFILLNNSNELLYYQSDDPIKIVGLSNTKELEESFKEENLEESFTIALMHEPDQIDMLQNYRIDIAFAGHSLGGQLRIPFIGGIIKKDGAKKYIEEHHKVNNIDFYVSSGIGTENIKFRTFNKPAINLYRLYNK